MKDEFAQHQPEIVRIRHLPNFLLR
jgi:hypothetical protein